MIKRRKKQEHEDTRISLAPLTFEQAVAALVGGPMRKGSPAEESCSTTEAAPESAPSKPRTSRRRLFFGSTGEGFSCILR
jgi:hypothetical protein